MKNPTYVPKVMHHPAFQKSIPRTFEAVGAAKTSGEVDTSGINVGGVRGTPDRFPPITVGKKEDEEYYRAMGYRLPGEAAEVAGYHEFPMWLTRSGSPDKLVGDEDEMTAAQALGYAPAGTPNRVAFEREHASPFVAGRVTSEYPKMVDGQVVDDPSHYDGREEYPKWVGDKLVHDADEERALLGPAAVPDLLAQATAKRNAAKAALEAAMQAQKDADAEMAALLLEPDPPPPAKTPSEVAGDDPPRLPPLGRGKAASQRAQG